VSKQPGVSQTLELLENLKSTIRDFVTREDKLNQELRLRISAATHQRDTAIEEVNAQLTSQVGEADVALRAAREKAESKFQRRKAKIVEAHRRAKKAALQAVDDKEGRRKHKLQTETLISEKNRTTGLANAETTLAEFQAALAAEQQTLASLEVRAQDSFRGYGKFQKLLSNAQAQADVSRDEYQILTELRELLTKTAGDLNRFRKLLLPAFFKYTPVWVVLVLCQIGAVPALQYLKIGSFTYPMAIASTAGCFVLGLVLHQLGKRRAGTLATTIAKSLKKARQLHAACPERPKRAAPSKSSASKLISPTWANGSSRNGIWRWKRRQRGGRRARKRSMKRPRG